MWRLWSFLKIFRRDLLIMLIAMRHPGTPRAIKGCMLAALLYLISPIDLIPDTIPFFGVLDDAVLVPAAIIGLQQLLPSYVRAESEQQAEKAARRLPYILLAASLIILLWVLLLIWAIYSLIFK